MIVHYPGLAACPQDAIKEILFEAYSSVKIRVFNLSLWVYGIADVQRTVNPWSLVQPQVDPPSPYGRLPTICENVHIARRF